MKINFPTVFRDSIPADFLFSHLLQTVNYRRYCRIQWASLAIAVDLGDLPAISRNDWQKLLLYCVDAVSDASNEIEALPLLCAAHAVMPLTEARLHTLAQFLITNIFSQAPVAQLPIPPSPRWSGSLAAAEWLDVPVRVLLADGRSIPPNQISVPGNLRSQCWEVLHSFETGTHDKTFRGACIRSLLSLACTGYSNDGLMPAWAIQRRNEIPSHPR